MDKPLELASWLCAINKTLPVIVKRASVGVGSFVIFEFCESRDGLSFLSSIEGGLESAWVQMCDWELFSEGSVVENSNFQDSAACATNLKKLEGCSCVRISVSGSFDEVVLEFSSGLSMTLRANLIDYDPEDDLVIFYFNKLPPAAVSAKKGLYEEVLGRLE